jgi:hypothetical protein
MRAGYDPKLGRIKTDAEGVVIDRAFLAHFQVAAADAVAAHDDGVRLVTLGAAAQAAITTGITNPAVPRGLSIVGNVAGVAGNVVITGTNYAGEEIEETLALNGVTTVNGAKAFKTVTNISAPAETHTSAAQTETIEVTAACSTTGDLPVAITAAALGADSPLIVTVPVTVAMNTVTLVAAAVVAGLNGDAKFAAAFAASNEAGVITVAAKVPAANDATLAVAFTVGATGITVGASTNGTAGVAYDVVKVGWSDKLGLPFKLAHNTVIRTYHDNTVEGTDPTVAVSAAALESNTIDLNTALNGKVVDVYLIV